MAKESIEQLARALAETLPEGVRAVREDLEKNFRSVLTSGISKLDLVTREEFEVQRAVLARTREKLAVLEARLRDLEAPAKTGPAKKASKKKLTRKKTAGKKKAKKKSG
jgi:BMFP domain-containing protein YqiC